MTSNATINATPFQSRVGVRYRKMLNLSSIQKMWNPGQLGARGGGNASRMLYNLLNTHFLSVFFELYDHIFALMIDMLYLYLNLQHICNIFVFRLKVLLFNLNGIIHLTTYNIVQP